MFGHPGLLYVLTLRPLPSDIDSYKKNLGFYFDKKISSIFRFSSFDLRLIRVRGLSPT